jgi:hypothetical protein
MLGNIAKYGIPITLKTVKSTKPSQTDELTMFICSIRQFPLNKYSLCEGNGMEVRRFFLAQNKSYR